MDAVDGRLLQDVRVRACNLAGVGGLAEIQLHIGEPILE
jgi:hypothetical protein